MASQHSAAAAIFVFLIVNLALIQVLAKDKVVLEEGYAIATLIDGHKLGLNPYSVLPRPGSSDLLVLDSSGSAFYTVSQESVVKQLSGNSGEGYSDGDSGSARFSKPRSFAVDRKGNVYVADKGNGVIRKISATGVSTIAGGHSLGTGRSGENGPAQNASFSTEYELAFAPDKCALLVSDRGSQLVRMIGLKPEDCAGSPPPTGVGSVSVWIFSLGISCLLGMLVGIVARPYIIRNEGSNQLGFSVTWKRCQILGKKVQTRCFVIRSAAASSSAPLMSLLTRLFWLCLSHLSLIFRINNVVSRVSPKECVSLLDVDSSSSNNCSEITEPSKYLDQLRDLMPSDGIMTLPSVDSQTLTLDDNAGRSSVVSGRHGGIDGMIENNFVEFEDGALGSSSGLVDSVIGGNFVGYVDKAMEASSGLVEGTIDGNFVGFVDATVGGSSGLVKRR